ncbi:heme peroxidase [Blyttiomyces helicus]|uniref:Peroxidase n=1 Tax=Blyttiomyces helicus TaxID=388810 RepID=A0A4V1IPZ0_9FUNG|nr:heme peroxidase [Blyttiomyces helicus]|eukprot:RKO84727.1 heme peroxidase [Blyttiomyces helicus]
MNSLVRLGPTSNVTFTCPSPILHTSHAVHRRGFRGPADPRCRLAFSGGPGGGGSETPSGGHENETASANSHSLVKRLLAPLAPQHPCSLRDSLIPPGHLTPRHAAWTGSRTAISVGATDLAMFTRIVCATLALAATAPLLPANDLFNRPDFLYQEFADKIKDFVAEDGCGGQAARNPKTGRVLPPIWLRFAFHDSANGSFGFDGSIIHEFDRPGNEGLALADMAHDFFLVSLGDPTLKTSILMQDTINLAAVATVAACGGPHLQYTSGLKYPGLDPKGLLPLPGDTANLTVENMERMGFTPEQVVAIVTGYHTLGGVHAANNPQLKNE